MLAVATDPARTQITALAGLQMGAGPGPDDFSKRLEAITQRARENARASAAAPMLTEPSDPYNDRLNAALRGARGGQVQAPARPAVAPVAPVGKLPPSAPKSGAPAETPADLALVIDSWPQLSPAVRQSIVAMAKAGRGTY